MKKLALMLCSFLLPAQGQANVEFLHWWTSMGETRALDELKQQLHQHKIQLSPSPVLGGGGDTAMTVLQARALAGNPPSFAQLEGPSIKAWDAIGILHSVDATGEKHQWDQTLYPLSKQINKSRTGYVALPLTLHRLNWLWVNHVLLQQLDRPVPSTWEEMFELMALAQSKGIHPLAVGEQPWQIAQLFENLVIATGGVTFYNQALVQLDKESIDSEELRSALRQFRRLSLINSASLQDTRWDTATKALASDQALFQLGGDWILGDLLARGIDVPKHIGCYPAPESDGMFLYNMDSLIFMKSKSFSATQANQVADILADKEFQTRFNQKKGSIPVHADIEMNGFNPCQVKAHQAFELALRQDKAVPSMIDSMAVNPVAQQAINSEIFRFYRDKSLSEDRLIQRIIAIAISH